jgi:DNA-binding NarL/FixJ family response regulator
MRRPVRVLLVDDHEIVRVGLRTILASHPGIAVVGEAATAREAIAEAARLVPDVVLMDLRLPDGDGVDVCRTIRAAHPGSRVVMLTAYADEEALVASVLAGASGYLLKQTRGQDVVRAIEEAAAGRSLLDPASTERLLSFFRNWARGQEDLSPLTDQERRVLDLMAVGKTNREIADALGLAEKTVKNYVSNILGKLHERQRTEAAVLAARKKVPGP